MSVTDILSWLYQAKYPLLGVTAMGLKLTTTQFVNHWFRYAEISNPKSSTPHFISKENLIKCKHHLKLEPYHQLPIFFLDTQETIGWKFTLKCARDMIITYSQMHRTDKYPQHSSIIWLVWVNSRVFVYELSGCRFESRCSPLNFRYRTCFSQGVP